MRLSHAVQIIGWGDTPTEQQYSVDNLTVLRKIERNLVPLVADVLPPVSELFRHELEKIRAYTDETVIEKFGIRTRQYTPNADSTELARQAAERAITVAERNDPNFAREKIQLVISGGSTPDDLFPFCAAKLQDLLKIPDCEAFDVSAACASGTQALIEAVRALQFDDIKYVLISLGETIATRLNDHMDENALIWGDGGSAIIVRNDLAGNRKLGIQTFMSRVDGSLSGTTRSRGLGVSPDHRTIPALNASMEGRGRELYEWVIGPVAQKLKGFLHNQQIEVTNRTFLNQHNGIERMGHRIGRTIGIPSERVLSRISDRGNQSSASIFSTFAYYADQGLFRSGDQIIMVGFGGGVIYNFVVYRWP